MAEHFFLIVLSMTRGYAPERVSSEPTSGLRFYSDNYCRPCVLGKLSTAGGFPSSLLFSQTALVRFYHMRYLKGSEHVAVLLSLSLSLLFCGRRLREAISRARRGGDIAEAVARQIYHFIIVRATPR